GQEHLVCKLKRSIYGLKQASRSWNIRFDEVVQSYGFTQCPDEHCVYKKSDGNVVVFLGLYVDDILLIGNSVKMLSDVKVWLSKQFDMKDLGEVGHVLGIKVIRDREKRKLCLSQSTYIDTVLKRFNMQDSKKGDLPFRHRIHLSKRMSPKTPQEIEDMKAVPYASAVGSLMYAMLCTRPDICYAVGMVARYQSNPGPEHWSAVKHILKYLRTTKEYMLIYQADELLPLGYTDSDFQADRDESKSTSRFVFTLGRGAIVWRSVKQKCVADSTIEAEYMFNSLGLQHISDDAVSEEPNHNDVALPTSDPLTKDRGRRPGKEPLLEEDELDPRAQFKEKSRSDRAKPGEDVQLIYIDEPVFHKSLRIGSHLQEPLRSELISFLKHNSDVFAWKHKDMKGIDPGVASHKLNLDRTIRPVVQKRRKLGSDRQKALEEEVKKLIDNKFIKEARYPTWVSNPVLVKKSNGLWRLCIDFSDLNKACPKDNYLLPHIDYMVDATSGHELMSFMDAYSGYNQIPMDPEDSEHTSLYSARGLYCYTMMPFGLKNAGATYQRLVNKMFATLIGHTMEVYVDNMLVKS
ncbi:cysteine-rich RLK (RECEPTOR-like protein kinase) 8, partial [Striga hermonthica]